MAKIDFSTALGDAFDFTWHNLGRLFRLCGLWLAVLVALQLVIFSTGFTAAGHKALSGGMTLLYGCSYIAIYVMFAVAWHRAVLLGDGPQTMMDMMHFGKREWRFLGCLILFGLIVGVPCVGAMSASAAAVVMGGHGSVVVMLGAWLVALAGWGVVSRLSLILPAIAVDESGGRFGNAWRRGKGNMLRLFFGPIVCALPFVIVFFVLNLLLLGIVYANPMIGAVFSAVIYSALGFMHAGLTVSFLSFCYKQVLGANISPPRRMAGPAAVPAE